MNKAEFSNALNRYMAVVDKFINEKLLPEILIDKDDRDRMLQNLMVDRYVAQNCGEQKPQGGLQSTVNQEYMSRFKVEFKG